MTTVLLIDDDPLIVEALGYLVEAWGHAAVGAESEDEAVTKLQEASVPDVLIVDWRLREGRTGGQAVVRIRQMLEREIPAIVVTGDTAVDRLRDIDILGCPVIHKPVSPGRLKALLDDALAAHSGGTITELSCR